MKLPYAVGLVAVIVACCCGGGGSGSDGAEEDPQPVRQPTNAVDDERIETMRSEPIFEHGIGEGQEHPAAWYRQQGRSMWGNHGNIYLRRIDPWLGAPPGEPTVDGARELLAGVIGRLREDGWTFIAARCGPTDREGLDYSWSAAGYRLHPEVADSEPVFYLLKVWYQDPATPRHRSPASPDQGPGVLVELEAPFHADPFPYHPTGYGVLDPVAETCVEQPDLDLATEVNQGEGIDYSHSRWELRGLSGHCDGTCTLPTWVEPESRVRIL